MSDEFITADVKTCQHGYVFLDSCPPCYAELKAKYDKAIAFIKITETDVPELCCHSCGAKKLLEELGEHE